MVNDILRKADAMLLELDEKIELSLDKVKYYQEQKVSLLEFKRVYDKIDNSDLSIPISPKKSLKISDMVKSTLSDRGELTSGEILEAIRLGWKPDLIRESLSPALSRMKASGLLKLEGNLWSLVDDEKEIERDCDTDSDKGLNTTQGDNFVMH